MTVSAQTPYNQYTGNGVATVVAYQFKILSAGDLSVYLDGVLKTLNADYTVLGVGVDAGGSVTFLVAPANGVVISIVRTMIRQRLTDYQTAGDFNAGTVNPDFDNPVLLLQDLNTQLGRSIRTPPDEVATLPVLPAKATRAGKFIAFDSNGQPVASAGTGGGDAALRSDLASQVTGSSIVASVKTAAETAAGAVVTDASMPSAQGIASRYGGALSAANWRNLHAGLGRTLCIQDVDKNAGMAGNAAVDTAAFNTAAAQLGMIGEIYCPQTNLGYIINPNAITFAGPVRVRGDGGELAGTMLTANGFATGQFMFKWDAGGASYVNRAGVTGVYCKTTNTFGSLMKLTRVSDSVFEDIFTEGCQDVCEASLSFSLTFIKCRTRNHRRYGYHLLGASNVISFYDCQFDGVLAGAYGIFVEGGGAFGAAAINLYNPQFEGFTDAGSYGIVLFPSAGEIVKALNIWGGYSENVLGATILSIPVDAKGVRRLSVHGHRGHSVAASFMIAANTHGIEIDGGYYEAYGTAVVQSQGGNAATHIHHNTRDTVPAMWSLLSGSDTGGVDIHDNVDQNGADADGTTLSPAQITANQNDYSPTGILTFAKALRLNTDASRNITGLAGGISRREIKIFNVGAFDIVLQNENVGSIAANRMALGADQTLNPGEGLTLWYDITSARWRAFGRNT